MPTTISGATGVSLVQDGAVVTADLAAGAVTPEKTQMGALSACIRLADANGYGSTNTKIRRFSTVVLNQGSDITYADSATLGALLTIVTAGVYSISYSDTGSSAITFGVSLNAASLTGSITVASTTERLHAVTSAAAGFIAEMAVTVYLPAGSLIRPHADGVAGGTVGYTQFTITRVA